MPLDVDQIGLRLPVGDRPQVPERSAGESGFLYVSDRALESGLEPLFPRPARCRLDRGGISSSRSPDARRFENWEFPFALVLGLGRAAEYTLDLGLEPIRERAWALAALARDRLAEIDGVSVLDRGSERSAIVTIATEGQDPADLVRSLRAEGINTSLSTRDYAVLDFDDKGVEAALRISPHYYNTEEEIDAAVEGVAGLLL